MVSLWLQRTLHFCNHHVRCMVAKLLCLLQVNVLGKIVEHSWIFCLCFRRMRSYVPWRGSLGNACWWVVAMDLNQLPNVLTMSRLSRMKEASAEREVRSLHDLCTFQSDMFSNALIFPTWKATIMKPCKPHIKTHLHLVHNLLYRWQNCIPKMMTCASYFVSQYIVKIIWCPKFEKCKKYGKIGKPTSWKYSYERLVACSLLVCDQQNGNVSNLTRPNPMDFLNIDPNLVAVKLYFNEVRMILTGMKCPRRCDNWVKWKQARCKWCNRTDSRWGRQAVNWVFRRTWWMMLQTITGLKYPSRTNGEARVKFADKMGLYDVCTMRILS